MTLSPPNNLYLFCPPEQRYMLSHILPLQRNSIWVSVRLDSIQFYIHIRMLVYHDRNRKRRRLMKWNESVEKSRRRRRRKKINTNISSTFQLYRTKENRQSATTEQRQQRMNENVQHTMDWMGIKETAKCKVNTKIYVCSMGWVWSLVDMDGYSFCSLASEMHPIALVRRATRRTIIIIIISRLER